MNKEFKRYKEEQEERLKEKKEKAERKSTGDDMADTWRPQQDTLWKSFIGFQG